MQVSIGDPEEYQMILNYIFYACMVIFKNSSMALVT